jgi:leader peptidase (prepilin peptidase)/N-methyltransferase
MTAVLVAMCAALGLAAGSAINRLGDWVAHNEPLLGPPSACALCSATIAWSDTIPAASWLVLRGRCRNCRARIPARYLAVELLTPALFAGGALRFGFGWGLAVGLVFVFGLIALAVTDLETYLLPVRVVYPVLVALCVAVVLAAAVGGDWGRLVSAVGCGVVAFAAFSAVNFANPKLLAFGDVRLAGVVGVGLGWLGVGYALLGVLVAFAVGTVAGVAVIAARTRRGAPMPFGVFLAVGAVTAIYAGQPLLALLHT